MAINKDGLEVGSQVDFATINRVERERKLKEVQVDEQPKAKRGRPAKADGKPSVLEYVLSEKTKEA